MIHPWHTLSHGQQAPVIVNSIIEIARDSKAKYELDKETGFLRLDRVLHTDLRYPFHYGFIPQTYCDDKDPLDVIILCSEPLLPLSIVETTVVGAIHMIDGGELDYKIIGIATNDPYVQRIKDLHDINAERLATFKFFFEHYKQQEAKEVVIKGFFDKKEAQELVLESIQMYKDKFPAQH